MERIEEYALIGDRCTAALVSRRGSIDWLCLPSFDSPACFAALVGRPENGYWLLGPAEEATSIRRYLDGSVILQTTHRTATGVVTVTDAMPISGDRCDVVRRIEGVSGTMVFRHELVIRFGYGAILPWVSRERDGGVRNDAAANDLEDAFGTAVGNDAGDACGNGIGSVGGDAVGIGIGNVVGNGVRHAIGRSGGDAFGNDEMLVAVAGPDRLVMRGPRIPKADAQRHVDEFVVRSGDVLTFELTSTRSYEPLPAPIDVAGRIRRTEIEAANWLRNCEYEGPYRDAVHRSLVTLRALTDIETGGIVAAPTCSLPEQIGGERNWDYRYCWLRDASLTLEALLMAGYRGAAMAWRNWLVRAVAGDPADLQIMYTIDGGREMPERALAHLAGYENSLPVRIGNGAVGQKQSDVLGEVMIALAMARDHGLQETAQSWRMQCALLEKLCQSWQEPDHGLWEIRGPKRHFTHSRVMVWVALDRSIAAVERHGLDGDVRRWREVRAAVREEVLSRGYDATRGSFTQHYETGEVDASLLLLADVGFIDASDERFVGTVRAIESDLMRDGLLLRYRTQSGVDGLDGQEGSFLACSFWLVSAYALMGRGQDAHALMRRLTALANDVGLLAEEYDPQAERMLGNFPQAFSHLALVIAAYDLQAADAQTRTTRNRSASPSAKESRES